LSLKKSAGSRSFIPRERWQQQNSARSWQQQNSDCSKGALAADLLFRVSLIRVLPQSSLLLRERWQQIFYSAL